MIYVDYHEEELAVKCENFLNTLCENKTAIVTISIDPTQDVSGFAFSVTKDDIHIHLKELNLIVLAHELIHAQQYILGQLENYFLGTGMIWKGEVYQIDNFTSPWEQQAYSNEQKVLDIWLK